MEAAKLVYDVGMHAGEDTEFYLSRGCRVVGIEANPALVERLQDKFKAEIREGRLHIIGRAIASAHGKMRFAVFQGEIDLWSSGIDAIIDQNTAVSGAEPELLAVDAVPFADVIQEHGMPYYVKVGIEGLGSVCVEALHGFEARPRYISIDSAVTSGVASFEAAFNEIAQLWSLGYRRFKYIDQAALHRLHGMQLSKEGPLTRYEYRQHSSGPFGDESPDEWRSIRETLQRMRELLAYQNLIGLGGRYYHHPASKVARRLRKLVKRLPSHSWYDLHARLGSS